MSFPSVVSLFSVLPFYAFALLLLFGATYFYRRTCSFSFTAELTERDNPAFGASFTGYLLGVAIALTGAFPSHDASAVDAVISMTYSGALAIVLMRLSLWINDDCVLSRFSGRAEILVDRNVGVGVAVAGSSIGTGLVLAGSLTGESASHLHAVRDIFIYWVIGQAFFIAGAHLFFRLAGYAVQDVMEKRNNTAAGISLGGFLVALGVLLWASSRNATSNILQEISTTGILAILGGVLLLLGRVVTEKVILPRINFAKEIAIDENSAAGLVSAGSSIVTALILAAAISAR